MRIADIFKNPKEYIGKEITVDGWIRKKRISSAVGFIELNDGSFFKDLQVIFEKSLDNFDELDHLGIYSTIRVVGTVVEAPSAKQDFEMQAKRIKVLFEAGKDYPLQNKRHSLEFMRTILHLRPRANTFRAVFKVRSLISQGLHEFFRDNNFVYIHTPLITSTDAEGAGEMFRVTTLDMENVPKDEKGAVDYTQDFFGKSTHLTVSGQLAVEPFAHVFDRVYTFGPTFRSENSNTTRHASEFWMVEPEMAFCDLECCMEVVESMFKYVVSYCLEHAKEEMAFFNQFIDKGLINRLEGLLKEDFARVSYTDAIKILQDSGIEFEFEPYWGCDIQTEHEKYLAGEHFGKPVFVTDYPKDIKAFYMKRNPDGKTVRATDLLVAGVGEIVGGSQREDDFDTLLTAIKENGLDLEEYQWYLDLRKYGSVVHSGFGLGLERLVQYITGMANIRDVLPYPRTPKNADF